MELRADYSVEDHRWNFLMVGDINGQEKYSGIYLNDGSPRVPEVVAVVNTMLKAFERELRTETSNTN